MSQDKVEIHDIQHYQHVVLTQPGLAEMCLYLEAQQYVASCDLQPNRLIPNGVDMLIELSRKLREAGDQGEDGLRALLLMAGTLTIVDTTKAPTSMPMDGLHAQTSHKATLGNDAGPAKAGTRWTEAEATRLQELVAMVHDRGDVVDWEEIRRQLASHRTAKQCQAKWETIRRKHEGSNLEYRRYREAIPDAPGDAVEACCVLINNRAAHRRRILVQIQAIFHKAEWLARASGHAKCDFDDFKLTLLQEGDVEMTRIVEKTQQMYHPGNWQFFYTMDPVCLSTSTSNGEQPARSKSGKQVYPRISERAGHGRHQNRSRRDDLLRGLMLKLRALDRVRRFTQRSIKFACFIKSNATWEAEESPLACDSCEHHSLTPQDVFFLGRCGHTACSHCLDDTASCVLCEAGVNHKPWEIYQGSEFQTDQLEHLMPHARYGQKIEDVVGLIRDYIHHEDQIICFCDGLPVAHRLALRLVECGITTIHLALEKDKSAALLRYQDRTKHENGIRVLILNIGDETAAGS